MNPKPTEKPKPELDPSDLRLWMVIMLFLFLVQDVFVPKSVLVRFIDNLFFGLIFQFLPTFSEAWKLVQHGLTYLILAWLFLRSVHRRMGTIGASWEAWKIGAKWGLGALAVSAVLLFLLGGIAAGFSHTPSLFGFLSAQLMQLFDGFGSELCFRAFLQTSVVILALRYLKNRRTASWIGIAVATLFFAIVQTTELTKPGLEQTSPVGIILLTSLILSLLISFIFAITNNLVLVSFLHGGYYFMSYWTVETIYPQFPTHIFLLTMIAICLVAYRSNPRTFEIGSLSGSDLILCIK